MDAGRAEKRCGGAKVRRCEGAKVRRCEGAKVRRCEGAKGSRGGSMGGVACLGGPPPPALPPLRGGREPFLPRRVLRRARDTSPATSHGTGEVAALRPPEGAPPPRTRTAAHRPRFVLPPTACRGRAGEGGRRGMRRGPSNRHEPQFPLSLEAHLRTSAPSHLRTGVSTSADLPRGGRRARRGLRRGRRSSPGRTRSPGRAARPAARRSPPPRRRRRGPGCGR